MCSIPSRPASKSKECFTTGHGLFNTFVIGHLNFPIQTISAYAIRKEFNLVGTTQKV